MRLSNSERTKSIQFRFLVVISIILLISTFVLSTVIAIKEARTLEHSLITKGQGLAAYIAQFSQDALLLDDRLLLDAIVSEANRDEDVVYTIITDTKGNPLTSQYASLNVRSPKTKTVLSLLPKNAELPAIIAAIRKDAVVREITVPISIDINTIGTVCMGMSKDTVRQEVQRTVFFVLAVNAMAAIILGTVLFLYSKRSILTPIAELAAAASRLATGDLTTRVTTEVTGEVQVLVDSFNRMAGDLAVSTVSKDYVDNIINSMMDMLIVVSTDQRILRVNAAVGRVLGYDEGELVCRPIELVIEPGLVNAGSIIDETLVRGNVDNTERVYRTRQGVNIPVLFSSSVMRNANREVLGVVCVARDITERKRDEEKLHRYAEELQQINEEMRNFAYIVSHDLRAPLVNIKGFSQELDRSVVEISACFQKHLPLLDDEDKAKIGPIMQHDIPEALNFIGTSVNRMDSLINAVLQLSRAGRRTLAPAPLSVQDLVQGILGSMAHQIEARNARVSAEDLPDMVADKTALEQIFGNLLDNAVKYLEPGRPGIITVSSEQTRDEIVFHVRDNGRGMAAEDIPKAFEVFRRVGKQDVPGEGMGLAFVRTLVRLLGGRIWCESGPGLGTTFSFTFPRTIETVSPI